MKENLKKLFQYYKPYKHVFFIDMFFAFLASIIALVIPLVVRYVTSTVVYLPAKDVFRQLIVIAVVVTILIAIQAYSNFYISNYGHVMGAKIEYDMRAEIFAHYQKLSFSFYDDQKVGQLMSRVTSDLFDITELLHHGPENLTISFIKIIGALIILCTISPQLTIAAFILVPFMICYAYFFNKKMKKERIKMISKSSEEYLKTMYILKQQNGNIRVTDIAKKMNCTKPSVNKAIYNLKDSGLVNYESYGTIELTEKGEDLAKKILEAYDIMYVFLKDVLNLDEEEAKSEAEKIKLAISDKTINKLAKYVHKELGLTNLDCDYDINKEKCRCCARRTIKKERI